MQHMRAIEQDPNEDNAPKRPSESGGLEPEEIDDAEDEAEKRETNIATGHDIVEEKSADDPIVEKGPSPAFPD